MDDTLNHLEPQLRAWAEDLGDQIPVYRPGEIQLRATQDPTRPSQRPLILAFAALLVLVGGGLAVWHARDNAGRIGTVANSSTSTRYERIEYTQQATLQCPSGEQLTRPNAFNQATFEAWADPSRRRWRNTVTYPDGSTRDLIAVDSPFYPRAIYTRGEQRGAVLGCPSGTEGFRTAEPGQGSFYSLNPMADIPKTPSGDPAVLRCTDTGTQIEGDHTDSRGRPSLLWRETVTGFTVVDNTRRPLTQITECFVDPISRRVHEERFTNQIDGLGIAQWTATLVGDSDAQASNDLFDTAGYNQEPGRDLPQTNTRPCVGWVGGRADGTEERGTSC